MYRIRLWIWNVNLQTKHNQKYNKKNASKLCNSAQEEDDTKNGTSKKQQRNNDLNSTTTN